MTHSIQTLDLTSFLYDIDVPFGKYTYQCGAHEFVQRVYGNDMGSGTWEFKEYYHSYPKGSSNPYQVAFIPESSYVMFEVDEKIKLWVCYTEEEQRGKGFMSMIFERLKLDYTDKDIIVDTFNDGLIRIANRHQIKFFRE